MLNKDQKPPLSGDELKKVIQDIFKSGEMILSRHARERMKERGYSLADIRHIVRNGNLSKTEKNKGQQYNYHIHGEGVDGHPGGAVVALVKESKMVIVTVKGGV